MFGKSSGHDLSLSNYVWDLLNFFRKRKEFLAIHKILRNSFTFDLVNARIAINQLGVA